MDRTFRITPELEPKVVDRDLKRFAIILACMLPYFIFLFSMKARDKYAVIVPISLGYTLLAILFFFARRWRININKKTLYHVTDKYIGKAIDADMSLLSINSTSRFGLTESDVEKLKHVVIPWYEIESITDKGPFLLIKSKGADTWKGIGMLVLPKEIEYFDELEKIIRSKVAPYGVEY